MQHRSVPASDLAFSLHDDKARMPTATKTQSSSVAEPEDATTGNSALTRRILQKLDMHVLPPLALVGFRIEYLLLHKWTLTPLQAMASKLHRSNQRRQCQASTPRGSHQLRRIDLRSESLVYRPTCTCKGLSLTQH